MEREEELTCKPRLSKMKLWSILRQYETLERFKPHPRVESKKLHRTQSERVKPPPPPPAKIIREVATMEFFERQEPLIPGLRIQRVLMKVLKESKDEAEVVKKMYTSTSYSSNIYTSRVPMVQQVWPILNSTLQEYGIDCVFNEATSYIKIWRTPMTKSPNHFLKARRLVQHLATSNVPPLLAIQLFKGDKSYLSMKIDGIRGLRSRAGIDEGLFSKRWAQLASSLEIIAMYTDADVFLSENFIVAVGDGISLLKVRTIAFFCLVKDIHPSTYLNLPTEVIYNFSELKALNSHLDFSKTGPPMNVDNTHQVASLCMPFSATREKEVLEVWPSVKSFFDFFGLRCKLDVARRCMLMSTTMSSTHPDLLCKAMDILQLLGLTGFPATKVIEILDRRLHYQVIKTWFSKDGLCTKYEGIEKDWLHNWSRLKRSSKALQWQLKCEIYMIGVSVVGVGTSKLPLDILRSIVECCFLKNEDPETVALRLIGTVKNNYQPNEVVIDVLGNKHHSHTSLRTKAAAAKGEAPSGLPLRGAGQDSSDAQLTANGGTSMASDSLSGELSEVKERIRQTSGYGKLLGWDLRSRDLRSANDGTPKAGDALSGELWEVKKERIRKASVFGKRPGWDLRAVSSK